MPSNWHVEFVEGNADVSISLLRFISIVSLISMWWDFDFWRMAIGSYPITLWNTNQCNGMALLNRKCKPSQPLSPA